MKSQTTRIVGTFRGWKGHTLFHLHDGTFWVQTRYAYWYNYAYQPEVVLTEENGVYHLGLLDSDNRVEVKRIHPVETRINGAFNGWHGESSYLLGNGQTWQQAHYEYRYTYAYGPEATLYEVGGEWYLMVADTVMAVRRTT
jgi:hypothetical protein